MTWTINRTAQQNALLSHTYTCVQDPLRPQPLGELVGNQLPTRVGNPGFQLVSNKLPTSSHSGLRPLRVIVYEFPNANQCWKRKPIAALYAKVSARQQCVHECLRQINARNIILKSIFNGLLHHCRYLQFSCCCFPNLQNSAKFRENSSLQQFKVVQGRRSWCQSKPHMQLSISHKL